MIVIALKAGILQPLGAIALTLNGAQYIGHRHADICQWIRPAGAHINGRRIVQIRVAGGKAPHNKAAHRMAGNNQLLVRILAPGNVIQPPHILQQSIVPVLIAKEPPVLRRFAGLTVAQHIVHKDRITHIRKGLQKVAVAAAVLSHTVVEQQHGLHIAVLRIPLPGMDGGQRAGAGISVRFRFHRKIPLNAGNAC